MPPPPPALLYLALLTGLLPFSSAGSSPLSSHDVSHPLPLDDVTTRTHTNRLLHNNDLETSIEDSRVNDTPDIEEVENGLVDEEEDADVVIESEDNIRTKRSSDSDWDKSSKSAGRVRTGDTILQIGGAVRDAIGDAAAAPGPRASSRLDSFVIRPVAPPPATASPPPAHAATPKPDPHEILVEQHATVRIPCDLNATEVRWYKDHEPSPLPVEGSTLVVGRAERTLAGTWRCGAGARRGAVWTLMIYERVWGVSVWVDGRRLDANTWVPLRDRAALRLACRADGGVPPPTLVWRLRGGGGVLRLPPTTTNHSLPGVSVSEISVTGARELHGATLVCAAEQRRPSSPPAAPAAPPAPPAEPMHAKIDIHVTYPPSFVISRWPGFGVSLVAGRGAALRCDVDANPPARAAWTRDNADQGSAAAALDAESGAEGGLGGVGGAGAGDGSSATLRWRALSAAHAGWYRCTAAWNHTRYSSIGYYLNVLDLEGADPPAPESEAEAESADTEEPQHQRVDVPLGGNVQLNCPKGSVGCWWRRVVGHNASRWAPAAASTRAHGALGIVGAVYEEGGEYRCVGARAADLRDLRDLKRVTLAVTGGATAKVVSSEPFGNGWRLDCSVCGRNLRVVWLQPSAAATQNVLPAVLKPDLATHCWRTVLHVQDHNERWCVASTPHGGAVAVFEARESSAPDIPPALRALHDGASSMLVSNLILFLCIVVR